MTAQHSGLTFEDLISEPIRVPPTLPPVLPLFLFFALCVRITPGAVGGNTAVSLLPYSVGRGGEVE